MKKRVLSLLMVLTMLATLLPMGMASVSAAATKTVVCVGDSITAGSHSTDGLTYPYQLAQKLGGGYTVVNRGRSGNVMYGGTGQEANEYPLNILQNDVTSADTVIIMLGTNDTKYWTDSSLHDAFVARYQTAISTFKGWNADVRLILATPPTSTVTNATWAYSNVLAEDIAATIRQMYADNYALDENVELIDVKALTEGWNVDHPGWYDDNVHFNNTGYERLANVFYEQFWDTTVHSVAVPGVAAADIQINATSVAIKADAADLAGKTATVTVADNSTVSSANVSLDTLPATVTVSAPRDGLTRTYTIDAVDELDTVALYTAEDLAALQGQTLNGNYKLMNDITLTGESWTPIAGLTGTFDGNGHTVTMNVTLSTDRYGFIKTVNAGSAVKDLTFAGSINANNRNYIGTAVYENNGLIENVTNNASITGAGAMAYTAGIVCYNNGMVNHCANTGAVSGNNNYIAGIAAVLGEGAAVANSYNTGDLTLNENGAGGIVGLAEAAGGTVVNCYNTGDLTSLNTEAGRIFGGIVASGQNTGGVTVTNCWNTGAISAKYDAYDVGARLTGSTLSNNFTAAAVAADAVAALNANLMVGAACQGVTYDLNKWTAGPAFTSETVAALVRDEEGFYHIRSREHFDWFASNVNANRALSVVLDTDIDLLEDADEWTPLTPYPNGYQGTFDGNGHTITGLKVTSAAERSGMFAYIAGGTVKDLTLSSVSINTTARRNGAVAGQMQYGTVSGVTASGVINVTYGGGANTAGIVGEMGGDKQNAAIVENCVNNVTVTLTHSGNAADVNLAGIVGQAAMASHPDSVIRGCVNNGAITGDGTLSKKVAGIAGETYISIVNCANTGAITGLSDVGGIVGVSYNNTIASSYDTDVYVANCYNVGAVTGSSNVGGLAGRVNMSSHIVNSFGATAAGSYAGLGAGATTANVFYASDVATTGKNGIAKTISDLQSADFVRLLNNNVIAARDDAALSALGMTKWARVTGGTPVMTDELPAADDEVDDSTLIETPAQLLALSNQNGSYSLANDITVTAADAAAIASTTYYLNGNFSGTLDGKGYTVTVECNKALFNNLTVGSTVKNLTIDGSFDQETTATMASLALTCQGTVYNVTVADTAVVKGKWRTGGLVAILQNGGVIENCAVTAAVGGADQMLGGVVGQVNDNVTAVIRDCSFSGSVAFTGATNAGNIGGILGYVAGATTNLILEDCTVTGTVTSTGQFTGGIVGSINGASTAIVISNCVFDGSVEAFHDVGGIAGLQGGGTIENCRTTAAATVTATVPSTSGLGAAIGGIVGRLNNGTSTVKNCVNAATVTGYRDFSGGIAGFLADNATAIIDGCVNEGTLNTANATGGILGGGNAGIKLVITNSANTGAINAANYVGGLVGLLQGGNTMPVTVVNGFNTGVIKAGGAKAALLGTVRNTPQVVVANGYAYGNQNMGLYVHQSVGSNTATETVDNAYAWYANAGTHANGYPTVTEATMKSAKFVLDLDGYTPSADVQAVLDEYGITLKTWEYVAGATPVLGSEALGSKGTLEYDGDVLLIPGELQMQVFGGLAASNHALSARLTADITLTQNWAQIAGTYTGTFDGDGHTVSDFKQSGLTGNNVTGLFQTLGAAGVIQNLTLEGKISCSGVSSGANSVGAFVCQNNGLIYRCVNRVDIVDEDETRDENGLLTAEGGWQQVGGFVGILNSGGVIDSCVNYGIVTAIKDYVGGVAGQANSNSLIVNCANHGEVAHVPGRSDTGGSGTGGILGGAGGGVTAYVINCFNDGFVYDNNSHRGYVGGVVGDRSYAYNCYNTGDVYYKGNASGGAGIGGRDTVIQNGYTCKTNNNSALNGTVMSLAAMKAAGFVTTLNNNVEQNASAYAAVLQGRTMRYWRPVEGGTPALVDGVTVNFIGKYNETIAAKTAGSPDELAALLENTSATALGGYAFTGWDKTAENSQPEFRAACENDTLTITVTAVYEQESSATGYRLSGLVDMTAKDGMGAAVTTETDLSFDQRITVTNATDKTVAYWLLDGAMVGFGRNSYVFYVSGNNTIAVVFTDDASVVTDPQAGVVLQQATYGAGSDTYTLTVIAQTSIPAGSTVSEYGVIFTSKVPTAAFLSDPASAVVKVKSSKTGANQQYMAHLLNVKPDKIRYARAYAIVDGVTVYSATAVQFKTAASGVTTDVRTVA